MQSLKAVAVLLAAASLCVAHASESNFRVEFVGNRVFPSEELRRIAERCYSEGDEREEFDAELLDHCLKTKVVEAMRSTGYVRAQAGEVRTTNHGDVVTVTVRVDENEFYRLGQIAIVGATHFDVKSLRELLPLKRGDIMDGLAVERWASEHLKKKYADGGFIRSEFDIEPGYRVEPGADEGVVDLTVKVNEGKRFILRSLKFEGDAGAPVDVMREVLGLKEGEVFKQQKYMDSVQELNRHELFGWDDGRFEDIDLEKDVELLVDEEAGALDIEIYLTGRGQERTARPGKPSLARRP